METSNFRSTAEFMPSLAWGDIQVGTADVNAGFLNILGREVDLRFVADRGTTPPGGLVRGDGPQRHRRSVP